MTRLLASRGLARRSRAPPGMVAGQRRGNGGDARRVGEDAEFPVVVQAGDREVLRPDQHLLTGLAAVGNDDPSVDVQGGAVVGVDLDMGAGPG